MVEVDAFERDVAVAEQAADPFLGVAVPDVDVDVFAGDEMADEGRIGVGDGFVATGEADALGAWPREPGGDVGFPLGGHAEAEAGRSRGVAHEVAIIRRGGPG